jgi:hypothetical protein
MSQDELKHLDDRIKVLEYKKKSLQHKLSEEARRVRTRRLIQKGALLEKYLENENTSVEDTEMLLKVLKDMKQKNHKDIERKMRSMREDPETY